jgi:hypothetical protein
MSEAITSQGDAGGRSLGLERTLRDQCSAVWRLGHGGEWSCVYRQDVEGLAEVEGFAEFFSSMVSPRLERGAEVTAKMGDWMVMAVVDEDGVLVGVRNKLGNPVTIRTAMNMIESRSQRGAHMKPTPAPRNGKVVDLGSASDAAPLRRSQRLNSPPTGEILPDPLSSSWSVTSARHASEHLREVPRTALPEPPSLEDDSEGFAFEIVFQDEVSEVEVPVGVGDDVTVAADERAVCAWGDVVAHLSLLTEQIRPHIGARVALNYWRDALGPRTDLADYILVDTARARLRAASPSAQIEPPHRDALTWAQEQWVARCALVVPDVEEVLTTLGSTPWL